MPDANAIEVTIGAKTGDYVVAMKDAAGVTGEAATQIKGSLQGSSAVARDALGSFTGLGSAAKESAEGLGAAGEAAGETGEHVGGLADHLKEFRQHATMTGRTARFFATDLAAIVPGADGAKGSLQEMIAVGLSGSVLIGAIEGIILVLKTLNETSQEHEKYLGEIQEIYKTIGEEGKKAYEAIRQELEGPVSKAQTQWRKDVDKTHDSIDKTHEEIKKYEEETHIFRNLATAVQGFLGATSTGDRIIASVGDRIGEMQYKATAAIEALKGLVPEREATEQAEQAKKHEEDLAKAAEDDAKWRSGELGEWKKHYDQVTAETLKFLQEKFDAEEKEALDTAKIRADEVNDYRKHYDQVTAETLRALQEQTAAEDAAAKKTADEQRRYMVSVQRASESAAKGVGEAFGAAFSGMIAGTEDVGTAFKNMLKASLKAIVDVAIASITASAAKAAAEAASSQAGIPIVGPALAAAAMAAMGALVMGLIDTLPSAAVGADIPIFSNPVMQLHGGEAVITHPTTDALKEFLDGGGGGDVHVHIHGAIDGASVHRVVHSDAFVRAIRDAKRTGRMP